LRSSGAEQHLATIAGAGRWTMGKRKVTKVKITKLQPGIIEYKPVYRGVVAALKRFVAKVWVW